MSPSCALIPIVEGRALCEIAKKDEAIGEAEEVFSLPTRDMQHRAQAIWTSFHPRGVVRAQAAGGRQSLVTPAAKRSVECTRRSTCGHPECAYILSNIVAPRFE